MKIKRYIIPVVFILLLLQDVLSKFVSIFNYFDEFVAVVSFFVICKKSHKKRNILNLFLIFLIFSIGIISNVESNLINKIFPILVDAFTLFKGFLIFLAFYDYIKDDENYKNANIFIIKFLKVFLILGGICLILNYLSIVDMTGKFRYGLKEFRFIYLNPGSFGYYIMATIPFFEKNIKNKKYIYLALLLIASTLKGPQLIFVIFYIYFNVLNKSKTLKKISLGILPLVLILIFNISNYQIKNYLLNKSSARYLLTEKAITTANTYFPIGSGFATYGSEMSRNYYSPLYYRYNFNRVYGLGAVHSLYINDNYWQMILGQFGYLGLILNIILVFSVFKEILNDNHNNIHYDWIKSMLICFLVGSIGSAYLTSCAFVLNMFTLCLIKVRSFKNE